MKTILALLFAVLALTAFGANPSFQSFNTNQFDVTGNQVTVRAGALLTNVPSTVRAVYVATTGSDAAAGTKAAPFLTVSNAIRHLGGVGTIIVRGGNYFNQPNNLTNCIDLTIKNYPNEVPRFFYGINIPPASFSALSNGIFTTTMSAAFSNTLVFQTNFHNVLLRNIILIQTNVPYGTQRFDQYYQPTTTLREGSSNRCEHAPIFWAPSVLGMTHSNNQWFAAGSTLYVKFAVSNVAGGIYIQSTNLTDCFVYGGDERTDVAIKGIRSYFGWNGFDVGSLSSAELTSCAAVGNSRSGIYGGVDNQGSYKLFHCEGTLNGLAALEVGGANVSHVGPLASVVEVGCYWHDNNEESSTMRGNTVRIAIGTANYGGIQFWGNIDDGTSSRFIGCDSSSNILSQWQLGNSVVLPTYQRIIASSAIARGNGAGMQANDSFDFLWAQGVMLDDAPMNIVGTTTSHFIRNSGSYFASLTQQNDEVIQGVGTAANFVRDDHLLGGYTIVGAAAYNVPAFAVLTGFNNYVFRGAPGANVTPFALTYDGGIYTSKSNLLVSATIAVGASPFSFTNTTALAQGGNISVYGSGQTTGDCTRNGGTLYTALVGAPWKVELKPGEYITVTYVGSPTMRWVPQ